MKLLASRATWGVLLILGGVLFLLENLDIIHLAGLFWVVVLGIVSVAFLTTFFTNRTNWWALIPGIILLSLVATILVGELLPDVSENWTGAILLGGIGLSFFAVYLASPRNWWAVIPGGVMLTIAATTLLEDFVSFETAGVFFLGLGLTFALLGLLPTGEGGRMRWPFFPALALFAMGLLVITTSSDLAKYIWPAVLILGGIYLLFRTFVPRRRV